MNLFFEFEKLNDIKFLFIYQGEGQVFGKTELGISK